MIIEYMSDIEAKDFILPTYDDGHIKHVKIGEWDELIDNHLSGVEVGIYRGDDSRSPIVMHGGLDSDRNSLRPLAYAMREMSGRTSAVINSLGTTSLNDIHENPNIGAYGAKLNTANAEYIAKIIEMQAETCPSRELAEQMGAYARKMVRMAHNIEDAMRVNSAPVPLALYADEISGAVDRHIIKQPGDPWTGVGHSWSVSVFLEAMSRNPKIDGSILMAGVPGVAEGLPKHEIAMAMSDPDRSEERLRSGLGKALYAGHIGENSDILIKNPCFDRVYNAEQHSNQVRTLNSAIELSKRVNRINTPALVIGGEGDPIAPELNSEILAQRLRNAEYRLFESGGHMFPISAPYQTAEIIDEWLLRQEQRRHAA